MLHRRFQGGNELEKGDLMQRRVLSAWLMAAFLLLTGCSGSSSSDQNAQFKASFDSVANQLKQTSGAIGTAITHAGSRTDAQLGTTFHQLATRWESHLSKLETLKPPSNVAAEFNALTGAASRVETDLNAIVAAARTHSKSAATQASTSLVSDILAAKS